MRSARCSCIAMTIACATVAAPRLDAQSGKIVTGTDVLEQMRRKYNGNWFRTLTFTQKTTLAGRNGDPPTVQTWYETLSFTAPTGGVLRIDVGNLADGNGNLATADSTWVLSGGKVTRATGSGNPFIPLIENVYLQPVTTTVQQLAPLHIDLSHLTDGTWEGRPAWVVGVTAVTDSTSPQFWIDKQRLALVRMILNLAPSGPPYDIQLGNLVATGGGWLATKVTMLRGGVARQTEEYSAWKTKVNLDPKLFDATTWSTARHWVKP
jgi:hypothetical protein